MIGNETRRINAISHLLLILMGILLLYLIVNFGRQVAVSYQRREELHRVEARLQDAQAQKQELQAYLEYARSNAAAEAWARQQGWAKEGEIPVVVVMPPASEPPAPRQRPAQTQFPTSYRQAWWDLFFGSE